MWVTIKHVAKFGDGRLIDLGYKAAKKKEKKYDV